ncbi:ABC transporter ATP-binding protein [Methanolacinia paynteri]|uniref:ABC transporter ATP-binding protein n=1 Tax=Methanolacinia paynteri TaxID=230356 RepID=UPI0006942F30|nr:ABC transporter ATP-binding protein [Methanolacinia paynteri]
MNAISVQNLGKKYKLFRSEGRRFLEYLSKRKIKGHYDFWALQDISFDVPAGTTLGILGQNGSGKSTLLSILAGVLEPSAGSYELNGKVSAILELGSGFHPDFSGRDNVYMYGSIMGLSRQEIDDKYDEIIRFSELGDYIDQPLRTYSSGMAVRLAFSVAVNVNADILIVDEALAVGDAIFQHRCFRKIREMQESGKTILYVGHDTEAVRNLCTEALLLDGGRIIERGDPNYVVNKYHALIADRERSYSEGHLTEHGEIPGDEYETVYDLVSNLSKAKIERGNGGIVEKQTVEIKSFPRPIIYAHPPSKIRYKNLSIEQGMSLSFAIGIIPDAWDKIPQGVKFDIEVLADGECENIFSRVLQPKRNLGDRGWHNFILSLEKYSGKDISLFFSTSGSGDDLSYCWSAWGWGKFVIKNEGNNQIIRPDNSLSDFFRLEEERFGNKRGEITKVELLDNNLISRNILNSGDVAIIRIHFILHEDISDNLTVGCTFKNKYCDIYGTNTKWQKLDLSNKKKNQTYIVEFTQSLKLNAGLYSVNAGLVIVHSNDEIEILDRRYDSLIFRINKKDPIVGIVDFKSSVREIQI